MNTTNTTKQRIVKNCVGQYILMGVRITKNIGLMLERDGWVWASAIGKSHSGNYYTESQQVAERTARELGLTL